MRKFSKKQIVIGGAAALALAIGGGAAYAYWTNGGSGSGNASTGNTTSFHVVVDDNSAGTLSPDGPKETITYHVTNTESGTEYATSSTPAVTGTSSPDCDSTNFAFSGDTFAAGPIASNTTKDWSVDLQMIDTALNQNACKGVSVTVQVTIA